MCVFMCEGACVAVTGQSWMSSLSIRVSAFFFLFKDQAKCYLVLAGPEFNNIDHNGLQPVAEPLSPEFCNYMTELSHLVRFTFKRIIFR